MNFLLSQIKQIREGDFNLLLNKFFILFDLIYSFFISIILLPFIFIIIIISKKFLIRFGEIHTSRIGHFATNIELYLLEKIEKINTPDTKCLDFFVPERIVCNQYVFKIWKKKINYIPKFLGRPIIFFFSRFNFGKKFLIQNTLQGDRDIKGLLEKYDTNFIIPKKDLDNGFKELEKFGLNKDSKFICLIERDNAYLNKLQSKDWSYHNYRDCNIQQYYELAKVFAEEKIYVIRMGREVNEKFEDLTNPYIIDYANSKYKSDFLDIFFSSQCIFSISTGCGLDAVPAVLFRKKMLFVDISPIGLIRSYSSRHTITLKNYYNLTDKRKLTLDEIFERCIGYISSTNEFSKNNVFLKESSPSELAMAAREMLTKIKGKIVVTEEDKLNQKLFWNKFKDTKNNEFKSLMHEKILCQISSSYLRNNLDILK